MRYGVSGATPAGSCSTRNRNCGLTSTADSAISIPASKPSVRARLPVELERPLEVGVGDRPPIGAPHQRARGSAWRRVVLVAGLAGRETKIRRRLGVSPGPWRAYGPMIETE